MLRALIIGYGNPLRCDDGFGWRAVERLWDALDPAGVEVIACHQLTPELAETLSRSRRAIFVDARSGDAPGRIRVQTITAGAAPQGSFSHHVDPAALLALARSVYGNAPSEIVIASVAGASFGYGRDLSPPVEAALPVVIRRVCELVCAR